MQRRAFLNLRFTVPERQRAFQQGLKKNGFDVVHGTTNHPESQDIFVSWNRIHAGDVAASEFEKRGLPVLICENASWGNSFAGKQWYTMARNYHNVAVRFPIGDHSRWDSLNVELEPFRKIGETVILPSRGLGSQRYRMPPNWLASVSHLGRVRNHPGRMDSLPLEKDLKDCGKAITWGSGAAIKALLMGIPVQAFQPEWIGWQNNSDAGRLQMFRSLAWAQWEMHEIESGFVFDHLLAARG